MCKNSKSEIPADNRENSNVNVGLLNKSREKMGDGLSVEVIMQYIIALICLAMVCKWLKKCWNRRQQRILNMAGIQMNHLNNPGQGQQLALPAPAAPPMPAPAQPVPVPIIVHHAGGNQYKPAIMSPEFDKMEQYRTQT